MSTELVKAATAERPAWVQDGTARISIAVHDEAYLREQSRFKQELFDTAPDRWPGRFGAAAQYRAVIGRYKAWKLREVAWYAPYNLDVPGTRTTGPYVPVVPVVPERKPLLHRRQGRAAGPHGILTPPMLAAIRAAAAALDPGLTPYQQAKALHAQQIYGVAFSTLRDVLEGTSHRRRLSVGKPQGFAAIDPETQRAIASRGGKASHAHGTAHRWTSAEAHTAGLKGGRAPRLKRKRRA